MANRNPLFVIFGVLAWFWITLIAMGLVITQVPIAIAQDAQSGEEQEAEQEDKEVEEELEKEPVEEEITVTGTRVEDRSAVDTSAPVDIIDGSVLRSTGAIETGKALQLVAPSFNFSTTTVSDGQDAVRPATLRSLGADQVLVLVNGKRRHRTALLNNQQQVTRGEAGTDINSIPLSAIKRIEVLRDGASAQYGSDAISGVINIILKDGLEGDAVFQGGQTYEGDGGLIVAGVNKGFRVGEKGVFNITGEFHDRGETNRAGPDSLRVSPPQVNQRIGDPDLQEAYVWANADLPAGNGSFYGFGGYSYRHGNSSGFFRTATENRTIPAIYPDGYLPTIRTKPTDVSAVFGYRGNINDGWQYDVYGNYGKSKFKFREENTSNISWYYEPIDPANPLGPRFEETPLEADTGTLEHDMLNFGTDFTHAFDWGGGKGPLFLATGFEWRQDGYQIVAGDPVSYTYGRTNNRDIIIRDQTGGIAPPGTQGFPGFGPTEEVNESRNNTALYVDAEKQVHEKFLIGGALRYEYYSDFGSTFTGKFSARVDFIPEFSLRGTISNGFRAPGVQQAFYSQRSTNLNSQGVLTDTLVARSDSALTRAFGISPLTEETSINYTLGIVVQPSEPFRLTVDYYRINIDDRIIFSSNIGPEPVEECLTPAGCPIRLILAPFDAGQINFFTNAIDTRTWGLDIVAQYDWQLNSKSLLVLEGAFSFNDTQITGRHSDSTLLPPEVLFDEAQVVLVEEGQPDQHFMISGSYLRGSWAGTLRLNYFGEVAGQGYTNIKQVWGAKWLTDAQIAYHMVNGFTFTFGGLNIFDVYPDKWDLINAPFPQIGFTYGWETLPFGINGASYYARVDYHF